MTLRHDGPRMGLKPAPWNTDLSLNERGQKWSPYFNIYEILEHPRFTCHHVTFEQIEREIELNGKSRFLTRPGDPTLVAAWTGHSNRLQYAQQVLASPAPVVTPQELPLVLSHGTYTNSVPAILANGLLSTDRGHRALHLMDPQDIAAQGLWRADLNRIVDVNTSYLSSKGYEIVKAANGVYLSKVTLPPASILGTRTYGTDLPDYPAIETIALDKGTSLGSIHQAPNAPSFSVFHGAKPKSLALPAPGTVTRKPGVQFGESMIEEPKLAHTIDSLPDSTATHELLAPSYNLKPDTIADKPLEGTNSKLPARRYPNGILAERQSVIPQPGLWIKQLIRNGKATCSVWYSEPPNEGYTGKRLYADGEMGDLLGPILEAGKFMKRFISVKVPTPYHTVSIDRRAALPPEIWVNI